MEKVRGEFESKGRVREIVSDEVKLAERRVLNEVEEVRGVLYSLRCCHYFSHFMCVQEFTRNIGAPDRNIGERWLDQFSDVWQIGVDRPLVRGRFRFWDKQTMTVNLEYSGCKARPEWDSGNFVNKVRVKVTALSQHITGDDWEIGSGLEVLKGDKDDWLWCWGSDRLDCDHVTNTRPWLIKDDQLLLQFEFWIL